MLKKREMKHTKFIDSQHVFDSWMAGRVIDTNTNGGGGQKLKVNKFGNTGESVFNWWVYGKEANK